jgi:hypothetical protein
MHRFTRAAIKLAAALLLILSSDIVAERTEPRPEVCVVIDVAPTQPAIGSQPRRAARHAAPVVLRQSPAA